VPPSKVRALSEDLLSVTRSGDPTAARTTVESTCRRDLDVRARRLRLQKQDFPQFPQRGGDSVFGPAPEAGSPREPQPEPPGEFVSEDLRADCARFLNELRGLIEHRAKSPSKSATWEPARRRT
jgi:hypothetical protein